jgi:hypothetical protein
MIPVFERAKTFHALDRAATVIGHFLSLTSIIYRLLPLFTEVTSNLNVKVLHIKHALTLETTFCLHNAYHVSNEPHNKQQLFPKQHYPVDICNEAQHVLCVVGTESVNAAGEGFWL